MEKPAKGRLTAATGADRRARRRADARLEILRAAGRIFRARGYAAAAVREIADAADLSAANLYNYFRGKDEILFFCQDETLDRILAALDVARRARGPVAQRLHDLAVSQVLCIVGEMGGTTAHFEVDALPPRLRAKIIAKRDRFERGLRALITLGIRRGEFRASDPAVATRAFLGALNWTAHWFRPDGPLPPQQVASLVADYAVAGLTGQGGNGGAGA